MLGPVELYAVSCRKALDQKQVQEVLDGVAPDLDNYKQRIKQFGRTKGSL